MLVDPWYEEHTPKQFAEELKLSLPVMYRLLKKVDWPTVLEARRAKYSRQTVEVDGALLKAAKSGDVKAIGMYYERFDGWVPTSAVKQIGNAPDAELLEQVRQIEEQLRGGAPASPLGAGPTATA